MIHAEPVRRLLLLVLVGLSLPLPLQAQPPATAATAQAALDQGRVDDALRLAEQALGRNPRDAAALLVRSTARCMEGDIERCTADLDRALALDPRLRQGWLNRSALAIAEKRYDDALAALAEAERLDPEAPDNALNQGAVELLKGDLAPATEQFRRYLAKNPGSAEALYLVATNYALSGYAALALQHLERAIAVDERVRVRARTDPNFRDLAAAPSFQRLLSTDGYRPPAGSATSTREYEIPWAGAESELLIAVLNALQTQGIPLDSRVEVSDDWALLWSEFRIKISRRGADRCLLELSAPPGRFAAAVWQEKVDRFYSAVDLELLKLERRRGGA